MTAMNRVWKEQAIDSLTMLRKLKAEALEAIANGELEKFQELKNSMGLISFEYLPIDWIQAKVERS